VRRERLGQDEILGWSVIGFAAGVIGGMWAAARLGRVTPGRLGSEVRAARSGKGGSPVALAESVRIALATDPTLAPHELGALPVTRGTVELTGWVPDRPARTRAFRVASGVSGLDHLINSILVRGEDDRSAGPGLTLADRSA
jgi:hypothetical protein